MTDTSRTVPGPASPDGASPPDEYEASRTPARAAHAGRFVRRALAGIGVATAVVIGYLLLATLVSFVVPEPVTATIIADMSVLGAVVAIRLLRPSWLRFPASGADADLGPRDDSQAAAARRRSGLLVTGCMVTGFVAGQTLSVWAYQLSGSTAFDELTRREKDLPPAVLLVFVLLIAPVCEEALLRAGLYPLLRRWWPPGAATVLTTCCFALLHGNLVQAIAVVPLGVTLAVVFEHTRRLTPVAVLHLVFNLVATLVPASAVSAVAVPPVITLAGLAYIVVLILTQRSALGQRSLRGR